MAARFKPGDRVQVQVDMATGHHRTPEFIQGKTGAVEALHGTFQNPDQGGSAGPEQPLYLVSFPQTHIWTGTTRPPQTGSFWTSSNTGCNPPDPGGPHAHP